MISTPHQREICRFTGRLVRVGFLFIVCVLPSGPAASMPESGSRDRSVAAKQAKIRALQKLVDKLNREVRSLQIAKSRSISQTLRDRLIMEPADASSGAVVGARIIDGSEVDGARAVERALVREGGALLPRGVVEITPAVGARLWDRNRPVANRDSQQATISAAAGLPMGAQIQISLPLERVRTSTSTVAGAGSFDVIFGKQLLDEDETRPGVVASFGTGLSSRSLGLGSVESSVGGISNVYGSITTRKRFDPVVLYGSAFVSRESSRLVAGGLERSGMIVGARAGGLLALSPGMSLSSGVSFWRAGDTWRAGAPVPGSGFLAAEYSIGLSTALTRSLMLELAISSRLLGPTADVSVSVALPWRF